MADIGLQVLLDAAIVHVRLMVSCKLLNAGSLAGSVRTHCPWLLPSPSCYECLRTIAGMTKFWRSFWMIWIFQNTSKALLWELIPPVRGASISSSCGTCWTLSRSGLMWLKLYRGCDVLHNLQAAAQEEADLPMIGTC